MSISRPVKPQPRRTCSHIDCAAGYGNEKEVGEALQDVISRGIVKREDLWITSKLWVANTHPVEKIEPALEKTLSDLQLSYLVRNSLWSAYERSAAHAQMSLLLSCCCAVAVAL